MNPQLQKIKDQITAKVPAEKKEAYQRIYLAGMKVMFDAQTHKLMLQALNKPGELSENIGEGIGQLLGTLYQESRKTMPIDVAMLAAIDLMCEALDFIEQTGKAEITNDLIAQSAQAVLAHTAQIFGITPQMMADVVRKAQAGQQPGQQPEPAGLINQGVPQTNGA